MGKKLQVQTQLFQSRLRRTGHSVLKTVFVTMLLFDCSGAALSLSWQGPFFLVHKMDIYPDSAYFRGVCVTSLTVLPLYSPFRLTPALSSTGRHVAVHRPVNIKPKKQY